jgi:hypothetical protein
MSRTSRTLFVVLISGVCGGAADACSSSPATEPSPDGGTGQDASGLEDTPSDAGARDRSPSDEAGFAEAPHAPFPQVPNNGGPILATPKLVTITFAGYDEKATVDSFGDWIVRSSWLSSVGHDYGVGLGSHLHVVLPGPAPSLASDLDTQALLEMNLQNGTLPGGALDAGTVDAGAADAGGADAGQNDYVYMVVYPSSTTATAFLDSGSSCLYEGDGHFLGGYHWETQNGPYHVPYAVIPTCTSGSMVEGISDLEIAASHEFIEATTDPFPYSNVAYGITDPTNAWIVTDGEVADLCEGQQMTDSGFSLTLVWSNSAAMGHGDPCIPAPPGPFYDVSPSPWQAQTVMKGGTATFALTGFSTAPISAWPVYTVVGGSFAPTVHLDTTMMSNGQKAMLTVTVPDGTPSQSYAAIFISSAGATLTDYTFWPIAVEVP